LPKAKVILRERNDATKRSIIAKRRTFLKDISGPPTESFGGDKVGSAFGNDNKMNTPDTIGIILAAGEGTRMKSNSLPKVLHPICGKPMLGYIIDAVRQAGVEKIIVVTGHKSDQVKKYLGSCIQTVKQRSQRGTGDALNCTRNKLKDFKGDLLVLYGDLPLITTNSLQKLLKRHKSVDASCTLLTTVLKDPTGFGRIVRDDAGHVIRIVEEQDASLYEKVIEEVNVGTYCFNSRRLFDALKEVEPHNMQTEFYLTDTLSIMSRAGKRIDSVNTNDLDEIHGVSSRRDLGVAQGIIRKRNLENLASKGITITDPQTTYIDESVVAEQDTVIHPFTILEGDVRIGQGCSIGPFCRIKGKTRIGDDTEVGNFVEIIDSQIGKKTKVLNHTYLSGRKVPAGSTVTGIPAKIKK